MKKSAITLVLSVVMLMSAKVSSQCDMPMISGNEILCNGQSITLTAESGYSSYAWSNGSSDPSISVTTPGVYQVTVTCANGNTAFAQVGVIGFTTGISTFGNSTICAGQCLNASVLLTGGSNGPYEIVLGLSTGGTETISVNPSGGGGFTIISLCPDETTTYTIQSVTNAQGCAAFINPNQTNITITVVDGGSLSINGPSMLCIGQTATLSADPANFQSYSWSNGGSGSSINITGPGTYSVTATAAGGCTATASLTVDPAPFDPPTITGGVPLCAGSSLELSVGESYVSYAWSNEGSGANINVSSSGTYTVTVTDANGCTGTDTEVVTAAPPANTSISVPSSICPNASATLTATGNFTSYQWSSGEATNSIQVSSSGSYTVTVTNSDGCTGTATLLLGEAPLPTVSFTGPPEVCAGDCLTFNVALSGTPPFSLTYTTGSGGPQTQTFNTSSGTLLVCPPSGTPPGLVALSALSLTDANCVCD